MSSENQMQKVRLELARLIERHATKAMTVDGRAPSGAVVAQALGYSRQGWRQAIARGFTFSAACDVRDKLSGAGLVSFEFTMTPERATVTSRGPDSLPPRAWSDCEHSDDALVTLDDGRELRAHVWYGGPWGEQDEPRWVAMRGDIGEAAVVSWRMLGAEARAM